MNKETLRRNLPAIIAISLPILLVVVIAVLTNLPNLGPKPQYDFFFTKDSARSSYQSNSCTVYSNYFVIENGRIAKKPYVISVFDNKAIAEPCSGYAQVSTKELPELFMYDTSSGVVSSVSFDDAIRENVKGETISPDGYSVSKRILNRGILELFGGDNSGVFISKKNQHIKVPIDQLGSDLYYRDDFNFIAWIEPRN